MENYRERPLLSYHSAMAHCCGRKFRLYASATMHVQNPVTLGRGLVGEIVGQVTNLDVDHFSCGVKDCTCLSQQLATVGQLRPFRNPCPLAIISRDIFQGIADEVNPRIKFEDSQYCD